MVSYDDAGVSFKTNRHHLEIYNFPPPSLQSFAAKGKFIFDTKLRGFSMWEAGGDSNNILLNSIREAGGYNLDFLQ